MANLGDDSLIATWNVEKGGKDATVRKILAAELARGTTVFMLQEVEAHTLRVFEAEGLKWAKVAHASNAVAWVPGTGAQQWTEISRRGVVLAPDYIDKTANPDRTIHTHSPAVVLRRGDGLTLEALSFHTPSRVQRPAPEPARMRVLKAAIATISKQGRASKADVYIAGGDGNVHLTSSSKWDFMRDKATGLTRIAPPKGTHAGGRKIDVFYIGGARSVAGVVKPGGGDHGLHRIRIRPLRKPAPKPSPAKPASKPAPKEAPVATSQNGWPALASTSSKLYAWVIPTKHGKVKIRMRNGSVGFLLAWVVLRWAEALEPVAGKVVDDWGWAWRPVRGQTTGLSNHASGTAVDINATKWPLGTTHMSAWQRARVLAVMGPTRALLVWGGVWRRPDQMHIEVKRGVSMRACERLAKALLKTPRGKRLIAANPAQRKVIYS